MECPFCGKEKKIIKKDNDEYRIVYTKGKGYELCVSVGRNCCPSPYFNRYMPIDYCPICGRELLNSGSMGVQSVEEIEYLRKEGNIDEILRRYGAVSRLSDRTSNENRELKQKIKELEEYINQPIPVRERKFNKIVLSEKVFFCYETDGSDCYDYEIVKKENEELKEKLCEIKKAFNAMSKTPFIEEYEKLKRVLED